VDRGGLQVRVATATSFPALLLCAALTWGLALPARAASVDFLYVEPSGGTAGGGHFGVQLGGDVYHFQSVEGWLRLQRWDADFFRYAYSVRENRTIQIARVEVDEQAARALGRRFDRRHGVGRKHESILGALVRDRQLLEHLRTPEVSRTSEGLPFRLRGSGLFEPGGPDPALRRFRARVGARYGAGHLEKSIEALRAKLLAMQPYAAPAGPWTLSRDDAPATGYRFSERFSDVTLELLALEALRGGTLRPQLLRELGAPAARLDPAEVQALTRLADDLEDRLLALLESRRPDRGTPILLGMARLVALQATLSFGRLTVLDAFPSDAPEIDSATVERSRSFFEDLLAHEARELRRSRAALVSGPAVEEPGYQRLEEATNRFLELDGALAGGTLRLSGRRLLPEGPERQGSWLLPRVEGVNLIEQIEGARAAEIAYGSAAGRVYGYDLWTHNCVTEVFRTVEAEFPGAESELRLGGRVDPAGLLHFVPAAAYQAVLDRYRVSEIAEIPSFRRTRLEAMAARDGRLRTRLRESNTLSSSLYRGDERDPAFLFFTEDHIWLRPLYGAFNLLTGVGQMAWGLVSAPFDGGAELAAGAEGVVFSVPELVFVNLRKGSMAYAPSEQPWTSLRVLEAR
jgi:hypothetical protein